MEDQIDVSVIDGFDPENPLGKAVAQCWMDVANDGGAVGFPFTPVDLATVQQSVQRVAADIDSGVLVLVVAHIEHELAGWVSLRLNVSPLTAHWAKIEHLQSHPTRRGTGVGAALLSGATDHAASRGLEHLILAVRGGEGLEPFYERYGWHEIGRHVGALRFGPDDDRDEVLMARALSGGLADL